LILYILCASLTMVVIGQGPDGEIYVLTNNALWRLERS
jgi:hypothetical protein